MMEYLATLLLLCTTGPGLAGLIPLGLALAFGPDVAVAMLAVVALGMWIEEQVQRRKAANVPAL